MNEFKGDCIQPKADIIIDDESENQNQDNDKHHTFWWWKWTKVLFKISKTLRGLVVIGVLPNVYNITNNQRDLCW